MNVDSESCLRAFRDDPEDDAPRLAFANWLDQNSQPDRAEWIRASIEFDAIPLNDPRRDPARARESAALTRCRPAWLDLYLPSISQRNLRGIFRFALDGRGQAPVKRLGKLPWLGDAFREGWLERIEVEWCDSDYAGYLTKWKGPVTQVPLMVRPAAQIDDGGLRTLLDLPQLYALDLKSNVLSNPTAKELGKYPKLHELTLELRLVEASTVDALFDQITAAPALKRVRLYDCRDVSDAGIEALNQLRPTFGVTRSYRNF
jgi:uncharacterized protein (TIGR02996 family)